MRAIIENIKKSSIWLKIHEATSAEVIKEYIVSRTIDYSVIEYLIDHITNNHKIDKGLLRPKFIVSILMIGKFPDEMVGTKRGEIEQNIVNKARDIYNKFESNDMEDIHKKLITFKIIFDDWKKLDKENQLDLLCEMYCKYTESISECVDQQNITDEEILNLNIHLTNNMDDEEKIKFIGEVKDNHKKEQEIVLNEVHTMRNKILHAMKKLTPSYKVYLNKYRKNNVKYDKSIHNLVHSTMKNVYWENMKNNIFMNKKCEIYKQIIEDYIMLLEKLNIKEVDRSILLSLHSSDIIEDNLVCACCDICRTIVNINKQVDSENYDDIYDLLLDKLDKNEKYVTDVLKICFNRLEIIQTIKQTMQNI